MDLKTSLRCLIAFVLFSLTRGESCPKGWHGFKRSRGLYCIEVFKWENVKYHEAMHECKKHGATLAGFDNYDEVVKAGSIAYYFFRPPITVTWVMGFLPTFERRGKPRNYNTLIGAVRRPYCKNKASELAPHCYPENRKAFIYVDGITESEVTHWRSGEPSNSNGNETCVTIEEVESFGPEFNDESCDRASIQGYFCGKMATPYT